MPQGTGDMRKGEHYAEEKHSHNEQCAPEEEGNEKNNSYPFPFWGARMMKRNPASHPNRFSKGKNCLGCKRDFSNVSPYGFLWENAKRAFLLLKERPSRSIVFYYRLHRFLFPVSRQTPAKHRSAQRTG